jgi:hypothetical protein
MTTIRVQMASKWRSFLAAEAEHCSKSQLKRLCRATEGPMRYESYLRTILVRQASILHGLKWLDAGSLLHHGGTGRGVTANDAALRARRTEFTSGLALENEAFCLFARIYLDCVAQFLGQYFGPLRGVPTESHDQLTKNFRAFRDGHGLEVQEGFEQRLIDLKLRIADFLRNCQITHELAEGTILGKPGDEPCLVTAPAYPANCHSGTVPAESDGLGGLSAALDEYGDAVQALASATRERCRFLKINQKTGLIVQRE